MRTLRRRDQGVSSELQTVGRGCLKPVSSRSSPGVSGRPRLLSRIPVQSPLSIRRLSSKQDAAGGSAAAASRECHAPDRMSAELGLGLSEASDTRSGSSRIPGPAGRPGTNTGRAWGGGIGPTKAGSLEAGPGTGVSRGSPRDPGRGRGESRW